MLTQHDGGLARLQGLYLGLQMLGKETALALSSWAAKASSTGRKALAMLGLDAGVAGGHRKGFSCRLLQLKHLLLDLLPMLGKDGFLVLSDWAARVGRAQSCAPCWCQMPGSAGVHCL